MGDSKLLFWFNVIVGSLIGWFAAYFISASVLAEFSWCIADEKHCVREWTSALSGWAAFFGAMASLPYLVGQWQEARKQTRFTIGDEDPTLDVVEHLEGQNLLVVRLVNWNRRAVFLTDIRVVPDHHNGEVESAIWGAQNERGTLRESLPQQVNGWENRSERPSFIRIDLLLVRKDVGANYTTHEAVPFPREAKIVAKVQMLGNVHRVFEIVADAFPQERP